MTGRATHGHTRGRTLSPAFRSWLAMRSRCHNPNNGKYYRYGARGIEVCERWRSSFENFFADMGQRPPGASIGRKNNDGNYEPNNCRWETSQQQMENRTKESFDSRSKRTECLQGHPYTEDNTYWTTKGARKCRKCQSDQAKARRDCARKKRGPKIRQIPERCRHGHLLDTSNLRVNTKGHWSCRSCNTIQAFALRSGRRKKRDAAMNGTDTISPCGTYRYTLTRDIPSPLRWVKPILFIMLNPSRATATEMDKTLRRCIGYAVREGCTKLTLVNLFALRSTDPKNLFTHSDPVGPDNIRHVTEQWVEHAAIGKIVVAWGGHPMALTSTLRTQMSGLGALCLGTTKSGEPRHPLMVRANEPLVPWTMPA
jgi:hypothetical protein